MWVSYVKSEGVAVAEMAFVCTAYTKHCLYISRHKKSQDATSLLPQMGVDKNWLFVAMLVFTRGSSVCFNTVHKTQ